MITQISEGLGLLNDNSPILVHGYCETETGRHPHAWVEIGGKVLEASNGNTYFNDKEHFYQEFKAEVVCCFDHEDVASLLLENESVCFWEFHTRETLDLLKTQYDPSTYDKWGRDFLSEYNNLGVS